MFKGNQNENPNQQRVYEFMQQIPAQQADIPMQPTIPSLQVRILRARIMMEELMETIRDGLALDLFVDTDSGTIETLFENMHFQESQRPPDIVAVADGLGDQEVVNQGTAVACGINMQPIFDLIMDNNMLKLETGTIDQFGKLIKSPDHPSPVPAIAAAVQKQIDAPIT